MLTNLKPFNKNKKGITLIEVVIYLAVFSIFFIGMINFFYSLSENNRISGENLKVDRATIFTSQHLEDIFKKGSSIDEGESIFDSDSGKLTVELKGGEYAYYPTDEVVYNVVDGVLLANGTPITRSDLDVSKFLLEKIKDNSDNLIGVRITIKVSSKLRDKVSQEFSNNYLLDL